MKVHELRALLADVRDQDLEVTLGFRDSAGLEGVIVCFGVESIYVHATVPQVVLIRD